MTTYETSTERLLAAAGALWAEPDRWFQATWGARDPADIAGRGTDTDCGTTACAAGWGVRFTPPALLAEVDDWHAAGAVAFGLEGDLARAIFAAVFAPASMPAVLRAVAALPEGGRTVRALVDAGWKDWQGANISGADLSGADLVGAYLVGANLVGANLNAADLNAADLTGANLNAADLVGAYLVGVNLVGANLVGANLNAADLNAADLVGANLNAADLVGANLTGAYLYGADGVALPDGWQLTGHGRAVRA